MDLLTLEVMAVDTPLAPMCDWDGDYWHASCLLEFFSKELTGGAPLLRRLESTSVAAPGSLHPDAHCYNAYCPHGRYKWTC